MSMETITWMAEWCAVGLESVGVVIIVVFSLRALVLAIGEGIKGAGLQTVFGRTRQSLGRGVLLGLEFLVAGDIVHTVAVELTLQRVAVLGIIVLIRTTLSFALEVELEGRWPWQRCEMQGSDPSAG
ncbi:MAG: DUF1622 domain-containing protein [Planctomycetota bacterium]